MIVFALCVIGICYFVVFKEVKKEIEENKK